MQLDHKHKHKKQTHLKWRATSALVDDDDDENISTLSSINAAIKSERASEREREKQWPQKLSVVVEKKNICLRQKLARNSI